MCGMQVVVYVINCSDYALYNTFYEPLLANFRI